ncbi:kinase-like domain-containing protein [Mucidula mucida]|nr:kinase-like domain-containing protein [Mucidula mucida]
MSFAWRSDRDGQPVSPSSPTSSQEEDDSEWNTRRRPHWPAYRTVFLRRGFRLDTVRDVKQYYRDFGIDVPQSIRTRLAHADDELCPDVGLPDNLFRGTVVRDGSKFVVKAVHSRSRELDIIRYLSTPPVRDHPMNHCIPVLDIIHIPQDQIAFIVMEQWSSESIPLRLDVLLRGMRQCIEHVLFMHQHRIAHLDISLRNVLTDYNGNYAYIDFEGSRRFDDSSEHCMAGYRGTEVPPECVTGHCTDPYKIDVWALAILILRVCKLTGQCVPGLLEIIKPMLNDNPDDRPTLREVLKAFDALIGYPDAR